MEREPSYDSYRGAQLQGQHGNTMIIHFEIQTSSKAMNRVLIIQIPLQHLDSLQNMQGHQSRVKCIVGAPSRAAQSVNI
jgi:hypothetical protein